MSALAPLAELCDARHLPYDARAEERFHTYMALLKQFNQSMNLIGPMDDDEIVEFLLADSVMAAAAHAPQGAILDVGSGAGLPGIPLKIIYPDLPITFVEPRTKRSNFIKIATQRLGLKDITIHNARVEDIPDARYETIISKAFQPPKTWITTAAPLRADGGHVLVMTRALELQELEPVANSLGLKLVSWASRFEAPAGDNRVVYAFA